MTWRRCHWPSLRPLFWWVFLPLALVAYTAAWLTPARHWYQPIRIEIADAPQGGDPVVSINRAIRRGFDGSYTVSVWMTETQSGKPAPSDGHVACAGADTLRYQGGLYQPHEAPLTQWADDPWCARLPPGRYYAEACWTVLRPFAGIVPGKTICLASNIFTIHPREE